MEESLSTRILIEIRDAILANTERIDQTNERLDQTNERLDQTNERLTILAKITQGIDTRLSRMETGHAFLPRRVDVLEEKVERLELAIGSSDKG